MCGIVGYVGRQEAAPLPVPEVLRPEREAAAGELRPAGLTERREGLGRPLPLVGTGEEGCGEKGEGGGREEEAGEARLHRGES